MEAFPLQWAIIFAYNLYGRFTNSTPFRAMLLFSCKSRNMLFSFLKKIYKNTPSPHKIIKLSVPYFGSYQRSSFFVRIYAVTKKNTYSLILNLFPAILNLFPAISSKYRVSEHSLYLETHYTTLTSFVMEMML